MVKSFYSRCYLNFPSLLQRYQMPFQDQPPPDHTHQTHPPNTPTKHTHDNPQSLHTHPVIKFADHTYVNIIKIALRRAGDNCTAEAQQGRASPASIHQNGVPRQTITPPSQHLHLFQHRHPSLHLSGPKTNTQQPSPVPTVAYSIPIQPDRRGR